MTTHTEQVERLAALLDPDAPAADRPRPTKANVAMHHKLVETVQPQSQITGEFTARVSDYGVDRQNERFARANAPPKHYGSGGMFNRPVSVSRAYRQRGPTAFRD